MSREYIRAIVPPVTFERGEVIHKVGNVTEAGIEHWESADRIRSIVRGSNKHSYEVEITVRRQDGAMTEYHCSCPAFAAYDGPCKHCVAAYLTNLKRSRQESPVNRDQAKTKNKGKKATDNEIKAMFAAKQNVRLQTVMDKTHYGKVRLEPELELDGGDFYLTFKIGSKRMYVLRDVFGLISRLKQKSFYKYGKELEFCHQEEYFEPLSQAIIGFIRRWCEQHKQEYTYARYNFGYSYSRFFHGYHHEDAEYMQKEAKKIKLTVAELEDFLVLMGSALFTALIRYSRTTTWQVSPEGKKAVLHLYGTAEGVELVLDQQPNEFEGDRYFISFSQGQVFLQDKSAIREIEDFVEYLKKDNKKRQFIANEDLPFFCREVLPKLEAAFHCVKKNFDPAQFEPLQPEFAFYLDSPQRDMVTARIMVGYGEKEYNVYTDGHDRPLRDVVQEHQVAEAVVSFFNAYNEDRGLLVLAGDEEALYELLTGGTAAMQQLGKVFISEALKRMSARPFPKVKTSVSLAGDLLNLEITSADLSRDDLAEILSKYSRKKKYYRLKNGTFFNMEEESIKALVEMKEMLGLSDRDFKQGQITLPKFRALYLDGAMKQIGPGETVKDKPFKALVRNMKTVEDNDFELPQTMENVLRGYQKKGFLWLKTLKECGFGGILADEMGLGKTLQAIAFLLSEYQNSEKDVRTLIVSPASLVYNWYSEIKRFAPALPVVMVTGNMARREQDLTELSGPAVIVTSYDLLKRDEALYKNQFFDIQIIDEAQYIKNHGTIAAKVIKRINSGFRLAMTGTPLENHLGELWSIFDFVMPGFLFGYPKFKKELETPIVSGKNNEILGQLQKMISPFVLRRLKKDVLKDLPDKLEKVHYVMLEGEQQKLYDAHVKRMKLFLSKQSQEEFSQSKLQILAELTKLRQICCDPALLYEDYHELSRKICTCIELIRDAADSGHKVLVFSQFVSVFERLQKELERNKISYYTLTGSTKKETRMELVERFNKDGTNVFCISLKAGGTGLNLTAADMVIHFDPWWNLAVQNQATDRAHRIGQEKVVTVYKIIAKGTVEEKIQHLQERKAQLAEDVLSGEGIGSSQLSKDELMELL